MEIIPRADDTASAVGNTGIDVVATTSLILYIETACDRLLVPYFEPGEASVGTRVEVDHEAPARLGAPVRVSATLEAIRGRRLIFASEVHQGETRIMSGYHHRNIVQMQDFSESTSRSKRGDR